MRTAASYYNNTIKPPRDFFLWCESHFEIVTWKYKSELIQSTKAVRHRPQKQVGIRMLKSVDKHDLEKSFIFRDVVDGRIETQLWKYERTFEGMEEKLKFYLLNLEIMEMGLHTKLSYCTFRKKVLPHLCMVLENNYGMNNGYYYKSIHYQNNWVSKVKSNSDLMYLPKELISNRTHPFSLEFLHKNRMEIEYCINIKADGILEDILTGKGDMRVINMSWLMKNKQRIKKSSLTFTQIDFDIRIEERGGKVVGGIKDIIKSKHIKHIPKDIGIVKWQNWAIKNKINIDEYIDYMAMLKDINVNDKSPSTLIPTNLTVAHDNVASILNSMSREIENKKMKSVIAATEKFEYEGEKYSITIPRSLDEIVREGKSLSHCVGSSRYLDDHRDLKSVILFVRDNNKPNVPLYTVEYRNNRIVQARGKRNLDAKPLLKGLLDDWQKHLVTETKARPTP